MQIKTTHNVNNHDNMSSLMSLPVIVHHLSLEYIMNMMNKFYGIFLLCQINFLVIFILVYFQVPGKMWKRNKLKNILIMLILHVI